MRSSDYTHRGAYPTSCGAADHAAPADHASRANRDYASRTNRHHTSSADKHYRADRRADSPSDGVQPAG
jgi:hypothetical protein